MNKNLNRPAGELTTAIWRTSSYSGVDNNCVEHAALPSGRQAVRDTKDRGRGAQVFGAASWRTFVAAVREGAI
ncbi:DUF397 domain-containing protein [Streptomyces sp. NPDC001274]